MEHTDSPRPLPASRSARLRVPWSGSDLAPTSTLPPRSRTLPTIGPGIPLPIDESSFSSIWTSHARLPISATATSFATSGDFTSVAKAVSVSAASSILSGYDQGVIAAAMLTMKPALGLTGVEQELSIGILNVTAALGGVLAGYAAERWGRKRAIALANFFFLIGSGVMAMAMGFWCLFAGRVLQGVGVGFALVVAPIYTAELVPAKHRGMLVSLSDVSTNLGILLGYTAGLVFLDTEGGWRWMFGVGAVPAVMLLMLIWLVPESPRWLVGVGRDPSALRALNLLYGDALAADHHYNQMASDHAESPQTSSWQQVLWHDDPVLRTMILRGLAIAFFSQAIGTEAVVYFAPDLVRAAGIKSDRMVLWAIMGVGMVKLVALGIASQLFDRIGRRPMLLTSAAGLLCGLLLMAYAEWAHSSITAALAIFGLCVYIASFSLGFSPLTYVICSELFPASVRARAMSLALFTTRIVAGIISSSFVSMRQELTPWGTWLFFTPIAAASFAFVWFCIPETKGHSLEQIADLFRNKRSNKASPIRNGGARAGGVRTVHFFCYKLISEESKNVADSSCF